MDENRIREIEVAVNDEDLFDDEMQVYDLLVELLNEVKRLHHLA